MAQTAARHDETETEYAVSLRGVTRSFGAWPVLSRIDLDIRAGEFVALLGASGCGKSTLLRILAELDRERSGSVTVPAQRAVVFQEPRLLPWKRVWKNVVLGLSGSRSELRKRAEAALAEVGLEAHAEAWPRTLSGGEAQRVALARSLVREPKLLLLDEPFGALDALTRIRMHALLDELCQRHRPAVLLVTHDVDEALALADRVLVLAPRIEDNGTLSDSRLGHTPGRIDRPGASIRFDRRISLARPRRPRDLRFEDLRRALLLQLGVVEAGHDNVDAPGLKLEPNAVI